MFTLCVEGFLLGVFGFHLEICFVFSNQNQISFKLYLRIFKSSQRTFYVWFGVFVQDHRFYSRPCSSHDMSQMDHIGCIFCDVCLNWHHLFDHESFYDSSSFSMLNDDVFVYLCYLKALCFDRRPTFSFRYPNRFRAFFVDSIRHCSDDFDFYFCFELKREKGAISSN